MISCKFDDYEVDIWFDDGCAPEGCAQFAVDFVA
jgi:hypothetical protein